MLNNVTSHTSVHYANDGTAYQKKSSAESFMPIIMIVVGIVGLYLLMNAL